MAAHGLSATVADARFAKPIDREMIIRLVHEHPVLITIEDGAIGGFASQVLTFLAAEGLLSNGTIVRPMCLPDRFVGHGAPSEQYEDAGLNARHIVAEVFTALKLDRKTPELKAKA
jgi:1-deoxy-D-xylulose-5-phosphate synthase